MTVRVGSTSEPLANELTLKPVTEELLQELTQCIVEAFAPDKVILFGSHAYGAPGPCSDVDILVIMDSDERPAKRALKVLRACRPRFVPLDILVRTPAELAHRLSINDSFFKEIMEKGRVLYER